MAVPAGLIFGIPNSASIAAGWERATELDDRHPKGAAAGADPGTAGGADTHTHNSPPHTHTVGSHSHAGGNTGASSGAYIGNSAAVIDVAHNAHTHVIPGGSSTTATLTAASAVFGTSPNDPPYVTVKWIRSLGTAAGVPVGAWGYWDAAARPSGWSSPSTARNKYLKGAAAGAEGGGSGGSSSAHSHAGGSHTHPIGAHNHGSGTTGGPSFTQQLGSGTSVPGVARDNHTHSYAYSTTPTTTTSGSASANTSGSTSAEPPYVKLGVIQNDNASPDIPVGIIGLWTALLSSIPGSLRICDGSGGTYDTRGKFVKGADVSGSNFTGLGDTGGAATHDHTDPSSHFHTSTHTHAITVTGASSSIELPGGSSAGISSSHGHASIESGSASPGGGSTIPTIDAADNEPSHRTVVFVKYIGSITVTITSPAADAELTSPAFTVTWTIGSGTQTNYRVRIYASDQATLVYDSGVTVTSTMSHAVPTSAGLRSGRTYYLQVSVTNNSSVPGDSNLQAFTTAWTPPAVVTGVTSRTIGGV